MFLKLLPYHPYRSWRIHIHFCNRLKKRVRTSFNVLQNFTLRVIIPIYNKCCTEYPLPLIVKDNRWQRHTLIYTQISSIQTCKFISAVFSQFYIEIVILDLQSIIMKVINKETFKNFIWHHTSTKVAISLAKNISTLDA